MHDFKITETRSIEFKVDPNVYSDAVISKVLYWLSADFIIERKSISPACQHILLICKKDTAVPYIFEIVIFVLLFELALIVFLNYPFPVFPFR